MSFNRFLIIIFLGYGKIIERKCRMIVILVHNSKARKFESYPRNQSIYH